MCYKVYATASSQHHAMIQGLSADKVFGYKDKNVVQEIFAAAKDDSVTIDVGYDCIGAWPLSMAILKASKSRDRAVLLSARPLTSDVPSMPEVEVKFVLPLLE